ncbi:MAG TPA: PDZ domain-containing protein, partial [Planctomycetota bacterium]|nr:PDZ domain-containing protein [Planctomycetota bacterium]
MDGYYRYPVIHGDTIVFTSEDDLWTVPASGGVARRLTSGPGLASQPAISPDGKWLAWSGRDEGHTEVHVMPREGGQPRRLTYLGAMAIVIGFTPDGKVLFSSDTAQPFPGIHELYSIPVEGGRPESLEVGPALTCSFGPRGARVIGRRRREASHWKRYRGGTAGDIWIDATGSGEWKKLIELEGNLTHPIWIGERIYFLSDHQGTGNLYSCAISGKDLVRHTDHDGHYARHPATDGRRIVYDCGADLWIFDVATNRTSKVAVDYHSPQAQLQRKFVDAGRYLEDFTLHPKGHLVGVVARGKAFTFGNWEGPVTQQAPTDTGRQRLLRWLHDGERMVCVSDASGEERLEILSAVAAPDRIESLDLGTAREIKASPRAPKIALSNHRCELHVVDLETRAAKLVARSVAGEIAGFDWSPDGRWLAYGLPKSEQACVLALHRLEDGQTFEITRPVGRDVSPTFDPEGKLLVFISQRFFDPVYDGAIFDLGFPKTTRPCVITLAKDAPSPFLPQPEPEKKPPEGEKPEVTVKIDLEGIQDRVLAFPVPDGLYRQVEAVDGKVLFTSVAPEGALNQPHWSTAPPSKAHLEAFDWKTRKAESFVTGIVGFKLSLDRKTMVYRTGEKLRVVKAGEKPDETAAKEAASRKSGWIDLGRVRVLVEPQREWRQMYREAWRLQREQFWTEDMSQVDWKEAYERYLPLLERVATRAEYADVVWEMQGELGTSHAYEIGGDYRPAPHYAIGFLGADLELDAQGRYRVAHICRGDSWDDARRSPLALPGVQVNVGDTILAVGGREVSSAVSPESLLLHQADTEIALRVGDAQGANARTVVVKTLREESSLRYREWVEKNRAFVHEKTGGRVGYVHVPDMGARGYSEFHRYFLVELERDGLVIDVRFNGGGHVSPLLLEKLARRRVGWNKSRWFGLQPYPSDSPAGPMVALTNEWAGSDGDIFSHAFKLLKLGPLIGKRTWGGVIGIWPRQFTVDGGLTTQPEFSFWFEDVGWGVENRGT